MTFYLLFLTDLETIFPLEVKTPKTIAYAEISFNKCPWHQHLDFQLTLSSYFIIGSNSISSGISFGSNTSGESNTNSFCFGKNGNFNIVLNLVVGIVVRAVNDY